MEVAARTPVRLPPLAKQVEGILVERIRSGTYLPDTQLPPEHDLAAELNVSRATVRSALSSLAALGLVIRRHGLGTFVTQQPRISNPLDQIVDFKELIARYCCETTIQYVSTTVEPANPAMALALGLPPDAPVLVSQKIFIASGEPVIYCINTLPTCLFSPKLLDELLYSPDRLEPIFQFLEKELNLRIEYLVARFQAVLARKCHFSIKLPLPGNTPMMQIDEVAYTAGGGAIFHTWEYHPENRMNFELIRRRVNG